jgi:hypothetical protein
MVKHMLTIEDKETRTKVAHGIIAVMGNLNPGSKESHDYKHKLWDQLHVLANFQLDVDAPFSKPGPEVLTRKPARIPYSSYRIRYRYYGKIVEEYLAKLCNMSDGPEKNEYISLLGSFMKSSCKAWNDENVSDQAIIDQMNELSGYKLNLAYDGQQFSIDMARSGKSINILVGENKNYKNKNKHKGRNNNGSNNNNNHKNKKRK